jgi:hypothetical protein
METFKQFCEDISGPIPGGQQPAQGLPPAQAPAQGQMNSRQMFMVRLANQVLGTQIPETEQGYNQLGRSQGIVNELSKPNGWARLKDSPIGEKLWNSIPQNVKVQMLTTAFGQQGR